MMRWGTIALGILLILHVLMTMWSQRAHEQQMAEVVRYIEVSTKMLRQVCVAISTTPRERAECGDSS